MEKTYNNIKLTGFRIDFDNYPNQTKELAERFFDTCEGLNIPWNSYDYKSAIYQACNVFYLLIQSTRYDGDVTEEVLSKINGLVEEIEKTVKNLEEVKSNPDIRASKISDKLFLIYETIWNNSILDKSFNCTGKIFNDYRSLYLIVSLINNYYDELLKKGFSTTTILKPFFEVIAFRQLCGENISEGEKLEMLFGLINGTMRFTYGIEPINPNFTKKASPIIIPELSLPETSFKYQFTTGRGKKRKIVRIETEK